MCYKGSNPIYAYHNYNNTCSNTIDLYPVNTNIFYNMYCYADFYIFADYIFN